MPSTAIGDRRAATDIQETREKSVREKESSRPEAVEQTVSRFSHRAAPFTTANAAAQPPVVSKYQDGLKAASAANMARFPAIDRTTTAKLNRFVFRKNAPEPSPITGGASVVPAGGGSPVRN